MADKLWTGASDTDWNTAGNWTGGVPGASDRAIFNSGAVSVATPPTAGVNDELAALITTPDWTGNLCSSGSPCVIDCGLVIIESTSGLHYLEGKGSSNEIDQMVVVGTTADANACHINGHVGKVVLLAGTVVLDSGLVLDDLVTEQSTDASLVVTTTASGAITNWVIDGGTITTPIGGTNIQLNRGQFTHTAGAVTALTQTGGTYNASNTAAVTISLAHILGGTFDATGAATDQVLTLTLAFLYAAGKMDLRNGVGNIAATIKMIGSGTSQGTLLMDSGRSLTAA